MLDKVATNFMALSLLTLVSSCDDVGLREDVTYRDSAGITIVSNYAPQIRDGGFSIAVNPTVTIGSIDGDPEYLFEGPLDARILSTGDILVADARAGVVRQYSSNGRHKITHGRRGSGPGEYVYPIRFVSLQADSQIVVDPGNRRLTIIAPNGNQTLYPGSGTRVPRFRLDDGTWIGEVLLQREQSGMGPVEYATAILAWRDPSEHLDTVSTLGGTEMYRTFAPEPVGAVVEEVPFGRRRLVHAVGNGIWTTDGGTFQFDFLDPVGSVTRISRINRARLAVKSDVVAAYRDRSSRNRSGATDQSPFDDSLLPDSIVAVDQLLSDKAGRLWARNSAVPGSQSHVWSIIDSRGRWIQDITIPSGVDLKSVGSESVIGVRRDSLGVQYVEVYRLTAR